MKQKLLLLLALFGLCAGFAFAAPSVHAVDVLNGVNCKDPWAKNSAVCQGKTTTNPIAGSNGLLLKIVRIVSIAAGIGAVIMIVIGGFKYVVASGDPAKITNARNTIIFAVVGLVVIALSSSIISFVINKIG